MPHPYDFSPRGHSELGRRPRAVAQPGLNCP
jgi:hypothetical protein